MKIKSLIVIGLLLAGLASAAVAQGNIFTGIYWLTGDVITLTPEAVPTEGRKVVFYENDDNPMTGPATGFSYDLVGLPGLSGVTDRYIMNAFQDHRLPIEVGKTYYVATVKGEDNYGCNPKEVHVTGYGFEVFPTLVLAYGEGIADPGDPYGPSIDAIWFGERKWQPELVAEGESFIISPTPDIKCAISSPFGINVDSLQIVQDEGGAASETYDVYSSHIKAADVFESPTELTYVYSFATEGKSLDDGDITLTFKASNAYGTAVEICSVTIKGGPIELIGDPLNYPSPVHLRTDREVIFQYGLTRDADIDLYVFDISARIVKKISCNSGDAGGSAGGTANPNKVTWDLMTDQGTTIGSGIYLWNIVDRAGNRVLGKGKLTAVP